MGNQSIDTGPSAKYILSILKGPDSGKTFYLDVNREYVVGREASCDIPVNPSDKSVSRKHARIKTTVKTIIIENLSQTNPILIKGKTIQNFVLKGKGQFQVGNSLFDVKLIGEKGARSGQGISLGLKFLFFTIFLIVVSVGVYFSLTGDKESIPSNQGILLKPVTHSSVQKQIAHPKKEKGLNSSFPSAVNVSQQDMKLADEHFRQGMFFYDAGNMYRSVEQWGKAIMLYPDHPEARSWFLKAERELAEQTKVHYQNAITHYKYMRYEEAVHEFKIVAKLSKNKNNDVYMDSLRYLDELQRK